jgi:hypothetical protein
MDAHTTLVKDWDAHMVSEWQATQNEFAVLSSLPPPVAEMEAWQPGGTRQDQIPRQCKVKFQSNGIPVSWKCGRKLGLRSVDGLFLVLFSFSHLCVLARRSQDYEGAEEKTLAMSLTEPLLSHSWSAAYSFSKCHLEESVPYDPFSYYAMPVEQFVRYARMWTRGYVQKASYTRPLFYRVGIRESVILTFCLLATASPLFSYDTYTPTRNYLFHDYGDQENGHGDNEWFHHMKNRFRMMAIRRSQKVLNVLDEALPESNLANLGLYGLGKRRSLKQLEDFTKMNFSRKRGNEGKTEVCVHEDYVPYDAAISPVENLYDEPANLDPQPEYPLRTNLIFAQQPKHESIAEQHWAQASLGEIDLSAVAAGGAAAIEAAAPLSNLPSPFLLALLWIFGLMVWCLLFLKNSTSPTVLPTHRRKTKGPASKRVYKDV